MRIETIAFIAVLEGKVREGQTVHVDAKNGALEFREK